jgi:hypothetical protein
VLFTSVLYFGTEGIFGVQLQTARNSLAETKVARRENVSSMRDVTAVGVQL